MSELEKAFLKAQRAMEGVSKDSTNPFFKAKYASYDSLVQAVKKPLNDAGLSFRHTSEWADNIYFVGSYLIYGETGEKSEIFKMPTKVGNAQETGSALSYARRYTLGSLVGVPSYEDDDGNISSKRDQTKVGKPSTGDGPTYKATNEQKRELMKVALELGLDDSDELRNISDYCLDTMMVNLKYKITQYCNEGKK